jgi:hypothetical protein
MKAPHEELEALFHAALELPENERASFLNRKCAGNAKLRAQVEALLAQHASAAMGGAAADTSVIFSAI